MSAHFRFQGQGSDGSEHQMQVFGIPQPMLIVLLQATIAAFDNTRKDTVYTQPTTYSKGPNMREKIPKENKMGGANSD